MWDPRQLLTIMFLEILVSLVLRRAALKEPPFCVSPVCGDWHTGTRSPEPEAAPGNGVQTQPKPRPSPQILNSSPQPLKAFGALGHSSWQGGACSTSSTGRHMYAQMLYLCVYIYISTSPFWRHVWHHMIL